MSGRRRWPAALALAVSGTLVISAPLLAQASNLPALLPSLAQPPYQATQLPQPTTRNGQEIFRQFREGLAQPQCDSSATSERWKQHFRHAASRMSEHDDNLLPLFGYVVDQLRAEGLPTEFALIPFVESGYRPDARSNAGPAGLWQFIANTARNHKVPMSQGVDGRYSASESTTAAVRYLKTLYGMFGGRWELAVMGYNAGEYRILQALRRQGLNAGNASPEQLSGLSPVTYSYVEKLHALSCVLEEAADNGNLMARLDREVPYLAPYQLPAGTSLQRWADARDLDADKLARLNPLLDKRTPSRTVGVLAPRHAALPELPPASGSTQAVATTSSSIQAGTSTSASSATSVRADIGKTSRHTVRAGESLWAIARRHGIPLARLLASNGLSNNAILKPGMELQIETAQ